MGKYKHLLLAIPLFFTPLLSTTLVHASPDKQTHTGKASYYSDSFNGRRTASGERFDNSDMTAAHRTFKMGSYVRVTNLNNGKRVIVRINDRGPFKKSRVIDLSKKAAIALGMHARGVASVKVEPLSSTKYDWMTTQDKHRFAIKE